MRSKLQGADLTKEFLLNKGIDLMVEFCIVNKLNEPKINILRPHERMHHLGSCAFYEKKTIYIMPKKCAHPGNGIRSWSWPGNTVDRTPYGVVQHEFGHYVDETFRRQRLLLRWIDLEDKPLTNYHGTPGQRGPHEDFAEMFRLFVTNPTLLKEIRSWSYDLFSGYFRPVENRYWSKILKSAPGGIFQAARNKVLKAKEL